MFRPQLPTTRPFDKEKADHRGLSRQKAEDPADVPFVLDVGRQKSEINRSSYQQTECYNPQAHSASRKPVPFTACNSETNILPVVAGDTTTLYERNLRFRADDQRLLPNVVWRRPWSGQCPLFPPVRKASEKSDDWT